MATGLDFHILQMKIINFGNTSFLEIVKGNNDDCDIIVAVHVDDLLCVGGRSDLEWLRQKMEAKYEIKCNIIGPDADQDRCGSYLGRNLVMCKNGVTWEPDAKHVDQLLQENGMTDCKPASTPYITEKKLIDKPTSDNREPMSKKRQEIIEVRLPE